MARRELAAAQIPLSARGAPGSARGLAGKASGRAAQSASPRPQRVRPVDAVRLAKDELGQKALGGKTARLRLAALPLPGKEGPAGGGGAPGLHEGFYDFASAIVHPKPSARDHATQLREWLDAELANAREPPPGGRSASRRGDQERRSSNASSRLGRASRATSTLSDAILVDEVTMKALPPPPAEEACQPEPGTFMTSVAAAEAAEPEVPAPGGVGKLEEAQRAGNEVELCLEVLEKYAEDTTTESKERGALLDRARLASAAAVKKLQELMAACVEETRKAQEAQRRLEAHIADISEDNSGLRHVVQQMLVEESRLRAEGEGLERKVTSLEEILKEANRKIQVLTQELESANAHLRELEDRQGHGGEVRDACNSPMMGFASFALGSPPGPDGQFPQPEAMLRVGSAIGGPVEDQHLPHGYDNRQRRRTLSINTASDAARLRRSASHSPTNDAVRPHASERHSSTGRSFLNDRQDSRISVGWHSSVIARSPASAVPPGGSSRIFSDIRQGRDFQGEGSRIIEGSDDGEEAGESGAGSSRGDEELNEPPELPPVAACAFPALVPFLDFSDLDLDYGQDNSGAIQRNREHLETHLALLEDEHQQALSANETLQSSVDVALEQLMVWVQAVSDSLQDLRSQSVTREVQALDHLRAAIEWLATHPCRDWTKPQERLAQILDEHEGLLRGALAATRCGDPEVLELRKALASQRLRTDELADSLVEARASTGAASLGSVRGSRGKKGASSNVRSSQAQPTMPPTPEARRSQDAAVQASLAEAAAAASSRDGGEASSSVGLGESDGLSTAHSRARSAARNSVQSSHGTIEAGGGLADDEVGPGHAGDPSVSEVSRASLEDPTGTPDNAELALAEVGASEEQQEEGAGSEPTTVLAEHPAVAEADLEAKKMRLLRSPFVEGIDLTTVPPSQRVLLRPEGAAASSSSSATPSAAGSRGLKTLHAFLAEVYSAKKTDDQRRDKARQPRRELHAVLQELLRQKHGVRNVVHQRSWLLVESLVQHAGYDQAAATFADFLDGTRDIHELSFYLYCSSVLAANVAEESQEQPPARPVAGCVAYERATRTVELLFGELPKALEVMYVDLQKCARARPVSPIMSDCEDLYDSVFASGTMDGSSRIVPVEDLYKVLLEGWRASLLLLEKAAPQFSWRQCILAFVQTDVLARGWLDPHEVRESEESRLQLPAGAGGTEGLRILERTSMGNYVFRAFHRCSTAKPPTAPSQASSKKNALVPRRIRMEKEANAICLQVSRQAFESVEKTLGVYLTWLMHSEDLRDLALYNSVKARIYGFRQAAEAGEAGQGAHEFRCLLLLLLSHQFDVQRQRGGLSSEHLDWELSSLLSVLRESWRRGASSGSGFGASVEDGGELQSLEA